jgi:phosphoenolpyruvate-protein phosphotransferase/dihydroxyacetone kinase phosphotransfer subunit
MVGLVLVSHSRPLAMAVRELVTSMTGSKLPVAIAAGIGPDRAELGTDATEILDGIHAVMSEEGVLVLLDIGSAILSAETAVEFLDNVQRAKVRLCGAPFVEGAVAAGVLAALGSSLEEVSTEAERALRHKAGHLDDTAGDTEDAQPVETVSDDSPFLTARVVVRNPHGLHARPAAEFIRQTARHDCEIVVRNLSNSKGPASAKSMSGLAAIEILQGHEIELAARGPDAQGALNALKAEIEAGLGEKLEVLAAPAAAAEPPSLARPPGTGPVAVSGGIAIGPLFFAQTGDAEVPDHKISDTRKEKEKLRRAIETAKAELARDEMSLRQSLGSDEAEIFRAQALVLDDPALLEASEKAIQDDHENAALAWQRSYQAAAIAYQGLSDEYLRQRAADVQDMGHRVLEALGIQRRKIPRLPRPGILITEDLTPADVAGLSSESVLGVICMQGGKTSHAAILLRARGIPGIAKAKSFFDRAGVSPLGGELTAAFDGESGELWFNPSPDELQNLRARRDSYEQETARVARLSHKRAITRDGHAIEVLANLGHAAEAADALKFGAEGVGLFRTEFLFLNRTDVPGEEEQFAALREVRDVMGQRPVVVRTLDIGGDKVAPGLGLQEEANPFLGVRAIRLCLHRRELFHAHLRAILRAGHGGNFRIMFPMIADSHELREARSALENAHAILESENKAHAWPVPMGIMIEVPSAALLVDHLAQRVDFFSIGTNDLTQYVLAADRDNPELAQFQDALHPAVLRLISQVTTTAHRHGRHVGVCGEAASDPAAARLLVGLGVDELSLAPALIPKIKETIRTISKREMETLAQDAQGLGTAEDVRALAGARF